MRLLSQNQLHATHPSRFYSGLSLIQLSCLLPFRVGFSGSACSVQSSGKSSMSFDIARVTRSRFLVALDGVCDLTLWQKRAAGVGRKRGTLPVDGYSREVSCFLSFRRGICNSALLGENASQRDVWSWLVWHH